MMKQHPRMAAFTLMELVVAIALMTLLLTLLSQVFNQTRRAISRGAATSEVIGNSRATSEQFLADAKQMLLPNDAIAQADAGGGLPGFMVIVQAERSGVKFPPPQQRNVAEEDWIQQDIRSDQLVFFRSGAGVQSLAPGEVDRFDSEAVAPVVRVWYGHVSPYTGGATLEPGDSPMDLVTRLVLGRQAALVLRNTDTSPAGPGNWGSSIYADPSSSHVIHTAPVVVGGSSTGQRFWEGATDAILYDYPAAMDEMVPGFYTQHLDTQGQPTSTYMDAALSWAFVEPGRRLVGTTEIRPPFSVDDVGRLHAAFIPYVSDFAIDFAADITDDYDKDTGLWRWELGWSPGDGDGEPDGAPDLHVYTRPEIVDGNPTTVEHRVVKWYTTVNPNPADSNGVPSRPNEPVTWPIPTSDIHSPAETGGTTYPPLYTGSVLSMGDRAFVFGHTGPPDDLNPHHGAKKWWPYMIRIRYRLHNANGDLGSIDPVSGENINGRWFEQIIPIPR